MDYYIGIDIGKKCLDTDWFGEHKIYENSVFSIDKLMNDLHVLKESGKNPLVICEATGGYEQKLVQGRLSSTAACRSS